MKLKHFGFVLSSNDPMKASEFYTKYLGFKLLVNAGNWYFSHEHPSMKGVFLDIIKEGHPSLGQAVDYGIDQSTAFIALVVDDIEAEYNRLSNEEITLLTGITIEPWGQKRFQLLDPDQVVIEIVEPTAPDLDWLAKHLS